MSLVIELQADALDSQVQLSQILRKALVVARKLKLKDFQEWVNAELNGYKEKLPEWPFPARLDTENERNLSLS